MTSFFNFFLRCAHCSVLSNGVNNCYKIYEIWSTYFKLSSQYYWVFGTFLGSMRKLKHYNVFPFILQTIKNLKFVWFQVVSYGLRFYCKSKEVASDQFLARLYILVVDDNPICLVILEKMLRIWLYKDSWDFCELYSFFFNDIDVYIFLNLFHWCNVCVLRYDFGFKFVELWRQFNISMIISYEAIMILFALLFFFLFFKGLNKKGRQNQPLLGQLNRSYCWHGIFRLKLCKMAGWPKTSKLQIATFISKIRV